MSNNNRFPSRGPNGGAVQNQAAPAVSAPPVQTAVQIAQNLKQEVDNRVAAAVTRESILLALKDGSLDVASAMAMLQSLDSKARSLACKVSEKGAVSVYGLQRMPVTLYAEQWQRLLGFGSEIQAFINANRSALSVKQS